MTKAGHRNHDEPEFVATVASRAGDPSRTPIGLLLQKLADAGDDDAKAILRRFAAAINRNQTAGLFRQP